MRRSAIPPIDISIHDASQVEIKMLHRVPEGVPVGDEISYNQDIFFFTPRSMGVNKQSYSKDQFYRSMTNYVRIKTPRVLADDEFHTYRVDRIMPKLAQCVSTDRRPVSASMSINEIRLFGAYVNDQLKALLRSEDIFQIRYALRSISGLLSAYRSVMDSLLPHLQEGRWSAVAEAFRYVDEFLSNRFEECIVHFAKKGIDHTELMKPEFERRDQKGYLQVLPPKKDTSEDESVREAFQYRMGRFKKYISEILFLEIKRSRRDQLFTNVAAAMGAMVAAIINLLMDPNQRTSISGNFLNRLGISLPVMVLVAATVYVFKDRVKDFLKLYLLVWFKPWLPDYNFKVRTKLGKEIGNCQEEMTFLASEQVPDEFLQLRSDGREIILPADSFEDVIHYSRKLKLNRVALESIFKNTNSLKDILRFDFHEFFARFSNPQHADTFVARDGELHEVVLPKVYHVNLVVRHQVRSKEHGDLSCYYSRARIILDRNGIKRIEQVGTETADRLSTARRPEEAA